MKSQVFDAKLPADSGLRENRVFLLVIVLTGIVMSISTLAHGQSVPVVNPGFDVDGVALGMPSYFVTGWKSAGPAKGAGVFHPVTPPNLGPLDYFSSVPSPPNVGFATVNNVLYQNTGRGILPYTTYTLTVWVGQAVLGAHPCCDVDSSSNNFALGDATVFGNQLPFSSYTPPRGLTQGGPFVMGSYTTKPITANSGIIGHPLQIYLAGGQFDNVNLTYSTGTVCGDCMNQFVPAPTGQGFALQAVIKGDVTGNIDTVRTANDPTVNPFAYVNQNIVHSGTQSLTATLDNNGNTVVTFTGSNPVLPTYGFNYGSTTNGLPHFGFDGICVTSCPSFAFLSQQWITNSSSPLLAAVSVSGPSTLTGFMNFTTVYANVTNSAGTVGQWNEEPFTGTAPIPLTFTNNTLDPETLSGVEYLYCGSQIPLDQLNVSLVTPPGCDFLPIRKLDGIILAPGQSITVTVNTTPEPSTFLLMGTGLLGLASGLRRRRVK
jgi:hypothetical protein